MKKLVDISFTPPSAIAKKALRTQLLIRQNLEVAVKWTIFYGVGIIQEDTPVDTGLLRASIAGEFGDAAGPGAAAGAAKSLTRLDLGNLAGVIGTAVEYAPMVEFGWRVAVKAITGRKYYKRDAEGKVRRVEGAAMFRKNAPLIRDFFREKCRQAVQLGLRGESMQMF